MKKNNNKKNIFHIFGKISYKFGAYIKRFWYIFLTLLPRWGHPCPQISYPLKIQYFKNG